MPARHPFALDNNVAGLRATDGPARPVSQVDGQRMTPTATMYRNAGDLGAPAEILGLEQGQDQVTLRAGDTYVIAALQSQMFDAPAGCLQTVTAAEIRQRPTIVEAVESSMTP